MGVGVGVGGLKIGAVGADKGTVEEAVIAIGAGAVATDAELADAANIPILLIGAEKGIEM